jgi:hypothetical protein
MKTIKSNFVKEEDYKTLLVRKDEQKHTDETRGGHNQEDVFKMVGFANKENAKRTIKSNFILDEDYKTLLVRKDEQKHIDETRCGSKTAPEVAGAVFPTKTIK